MRSIRSGLELNRANESIDEESDLDQEELDDEDQIRPDWMVLSEMRMWIFLQIWVHAILIEITTGSVMLDAFIQI